MPDPTSEDAESSTDPELLDAAALIDLDQWLEQLRRSDRSLYNLMALEVWSIARTMDNLLPGFWNRFMENRQIALKQFVQHRKAQQAKEAKREG